MGLRSDDFVGRLLFREYTRNNRYRESLYTVLTQSLYCVLRRRTNKARTNGSPGGRVCRPWCNAIRPRTSCTGFAQKRVSRSTNRNVVVLCGPVTPALLCRRTRSHGFRRPKESLIFGLFCFRQPQLPHTGNTFTRTKPRI